MPCTHEEETQKTEEVRPVKKVWRVTVGTGYAKMEEPVYECQVRMESRALEEELR